jgi:hypothetical protein
METDPGFVHTVDDQISWTIDGYRGVERYWITVNVEKFGYLPRSILHDDTVMAIDRTGR